MKVIKLYSEDNVPSEFSYPTRGYVEYAIYALFCFDINKANFYWIEEEGKNYLFITDESDKSKVIEAVNKKEYIDFNPNEDRLLGYRAFNKLWKLMSEKIAKVREVLSEVK